MDKIIWPIDKLRNWDKNPICKSCNSRKQDRLFWVDNLELDLAYGDWLL